MWPFKMSEQDKEQSRRIIEAERIELSARRAIQERCDHVHFTMYGHNLIGEASCKDCGYTDKAYVFYNRLTDRLIRLAEKFEKMTND